VERIGTVVRLQVQRSRLKPGSRGARVYDPTPLLEVSELEVGPRGVVGLTADGPVLDVHHADHHDTRNVKLLNGLSLLPRAHYDVMRARFGDHLLDGTAGESLLLATDGTWSAEVLAGPLALEAVGGELLELTDPMVASPCVEFSRFCLGRPLGPVDDEVQGAMRELDGGVRGFYARTAGTARVQAGAGLFRRAAGLPGTAETHL
jgi:hypothetical protein